MTRVRIIPLLTACYIGGLVEAGSNTALVEAMRTRLAESGDPSLDVPDMEFVRAEEFGIETDVYVASDSFKPVLCCQGRKTVPLWRDAAQVLQGIAGTGAGRTPEVGAKDGRPAPQGGSE